MKYITSWVLGIAFIIAPISFASAWSSMQYPSYGYGNSHMMQYYQPQSQQLYWCNGYYSYSPCTYNYNYYPQQYMTYPTYSYYYYQPTYSYAYAYSYPLVSNTYAYQNAYYDGYGDGYDYWY